MILRYTPCRSFSFSTVESIVLYLCDQSLLNLPLGMGYLDSEWLCNQTSGTDGSLWVPGYRWATRWSGPVRSGSCPTLVLLAKQKHLDIIVIYAGPVRSKALFIMTSILFPKSPWSVSLGSGTKCPPQRVST